MFVVIPDVLTPAQIAAIRANLSDDDFIDGKKTAGGRARDIKNNLQTDRKSDRMQEAQRIILAALAKNSTFQAVAAPAKIIPPRFNLYREGMYYGDHVDNAIMGDAEDKLRVDMSFTLFMNDPSEYDGGDLVIRTSIGSKSYKLPAGHLVTYPTYYFHEVQPVTRGERLACISWMQSMIRDPIKREIMLDLAIASSLVEARDPRATLEALNTLDKVRKNLLRQWVER